MTVLGGTFFLIHKIVILGVVYIVGTENYFPNLIVAGLMALVFSFYVIVILYSYCKSRIQIGQTN